METERLLAAEPRNPSYRNLKAAILSRIGEYDESIRIYADVLAEYPTQAEGVDELRPRIEDGRSQQGQH